jgi:glycerophosphoryl diester phosphodiesterase
MRLTGWEDVQQRLPSLINPPISFAHRGARAHAPENTIEAFRLGLKLGATGLESDVWVTADHEVVLDHDGEIRTSFLGKSPIADLRRSELPDHIPTLHELFEACGTDFHLSLDLKDAESGPAVIDLVRSSAPELLPRLWLCHYDLDALYRLRSLDDAVKLVDSTRLSRIAEGPERRAALLADAGIDCINMRRPDWNGGLVTLFHRFERITFSWDLQHDYQLETAIRMGLDGLYSDHVDRMVDALEKESEQPPGP